METLKDQAVIVGIGQTDFSKNSGRSELALAAECVKAAIQDAGLSPVDIDGMTTFTLDSTDEIEVARSLGIGDLTFYSRIPHGGGAAIGIVHQAAMAVATGSAKYVVGYRAQHRSPEAGTTVSRHHHRVAVERFHRRANGIAGTTFNDARLGRDAALAQQTGDAIEILARLLTLALDRLMRDLRRDLTGRQWLDRSGRGVRDDLRLGVDRLQGDDRRAEFLCKRGRVPGRRFR